MDVSLLETLKAELNPLYHFLALLGAHPILHVSGVRVKKINTKYFMEIKEEKRKTYFSFFSLAEK